MEHGKLVLTLPKRSSSRKYACPERGGVAFRIKLDEKHVAHLKRPACSERCQLDLPGFKNQEGLPIGMFLA